MARPKNNLFRDNIKVQELITRDREAGLTLDEIAEKYPQYSKITYKRFLSKNNIKPLISVRQTDRYIEHQRSVQKKAWRNRSAPEKEKHIKHLRSLAESQRGKVPTRPKSWEENNKKHIKRLNAQYRQIMESRYGVSNASYLGDVIEKRKKTFLERFGVESYFQTEEFANLPIVVNNSSKSELEIRDWVRSLGIDCEKTRQFGKEIDIYIESQKIGIEYHGLFWHSEYSKDRNYHNEKRLECTKRGVKLIQIFEHEWRDRKRQVKAFLLSALGRNEHKIGARKLHFKEVPREEAKDFLEKYHIQGATSFIAAIGGYLDNKLLVLATFGRHHRDARTIVLSRFVTKENWTVAGSLSKLSKMGCERFGTLISWCDLRWSDGNGYRKSGWVEEKTLNPDYFYTNGRYVISKQSRRKSVVGTPSEMTEHEHALLDGLYRVYDCGKIRFIFSSDNRCQIPTSF